MRTLKFQIRLHTGQIDQLSMEAERVLIGSGAHCEIRLPVDQARVEHVLIELGPSGIFARALNFEPPPTINNIPFQQAPLPPGSVLGVGGCQILVELVEGAGGAAGKQKKKTSPLMYIAMAIIVPPEPEQGFIGLGSQADAPTTGVAGEASANPASTGGQPSPSGHRHASR